MFMNYLHTKFHMPSYNGSLDITTKLITFHVATILLIALYRNYLNNSTLFLKLLLAHKTSRPYINWH